MALRGPAAGQCLTMNALSLRFRALLAPTLSRPWRRPLFGRPPPQLETVWSGVTVWADDAYDVGAMLSIDVLCKGGEALCFTARVAWVKPQPADAPALFQLGLEILRFEDGSWERLEPLLG